MTNLLSSENKRLLFNCFPYDFKSSVSGENFIDDEASLSGDDVGSDIDEDDLQNEYEKEEGSLYFPYSFLILHF